ncbi:group III truncated hemoglobin [Puia sp. P3]|uniref:group III truncated hemoglobin n=1 Tax=Puia sp. P3 TaxID=3423952 RepID=UPI003D678858
MSTHSDIAGLQDIKTLVDRFYDKVRNDDLLGPVFDARIKDWQPHLDTMYNFWNMALFAETGYKGQPFSKHADLPVDSAHFNRWLHLFMTTLNENFEGPVAGEAMQKAGAVARTFLSRITQIRETKG